MFTIKYLVRFFSTAATDWLDWQLTGFNGGMTTAKKAIAYAYNESRNEVFRATAIAILMVWR